MEVEQSKNTFSVEEVFFSVERNTRIQFVAAIQNVGMEIA